MINRTLLDRWDAALTAEIDTQLPDNVPPYLAENRTVLHPGAAPAAIEEAERRLGFSLPPSYRHFLLLSDGAHADAIGMTVGSGWTADGSADRQGYGLLPVGSLEREPRLWWSDWGQEPFDGEIDPNYRSAVPEWQYLDHRATQDPVWFKTGHLRHTLSISSNHDGSEVMLDPLVRRPDGEWELWDFSTKFPGTYRLSSFEALIRQQIDDPPTYAVEYPVDVDAALRTLARPDADANERIEAIHQLWVSGLGKDEPDPRFRREAFRLATDPGADRYVRGRAARLLTNGPQVDIDLLLRLMEDPEALVWQAVVPRLAAEDDLRARSAALAALTRPGLDGSVARSLWSIDPTDVAWEAFRQTDNLDLLERLAFRGHPEARRVAVDRLCDPDIPAARRQGLAYALRHPCSDLADDLVAAADLPGAPLTQIGRALAESASPHQAVPILSRALTDEANPYAGEAAGRLAHIGSKEAMDTLIEALERRRPVAAGIIHALGCFPHADATAAVLARAHEATVRADPDDPDLLRSAIYALEDQATPEARDGLTSLDHLQSWRALARLGDERALAPLMMRAQQADREIRREALDGLRDLAHPESIPLLTDTLACVAPDSDEAAICAHALAAMRAPMASSTLTRLIPLSKNNHLRRVAGDWLTQLKD